MSIGALVLGLLNGLSIGLLAVGLVLVYRSSRFLNLAHGQMGALPALLLAKVVLDWGWSWWIAFVACVAVGIITGFVVDRFFVRRLRTKTSSTVAMLLLTIGISQLLLALTYVTTLGPDTTNLAIHGYPQPFTAHPAVGGVVLSASNLLVLFLVPSLVAAIALFLRFSLLGKKIRAAADNPAAARLCGVSPVRMSAFTWALAGGLSAIAAILQAPTQASFNAPTLGPYLLFLTLGAAAFAAFTSLTGALVGGLVLGVTSQMVSAATSSTGDAQLAVVILTLLVIIVRGRAIAAAFAGSGSPVPPRSRRPIPSSVAGLAHVRYQPRALGLGAIAVAVVLPTLPYFKTEPHRFLLVLVLAYAMVTVALTVVMGWAGQVSLGHFALVGMGAFVTARLVPHGWSLPLLVIVAGLLGAAALTLVGLPALRVPGTTFAVVSLGLAVIAPVWLFNQHWFGSDQASGVAIDAVRVPGFGQPSTQLSIYYTALVVLIAMMFLASALRRSGPGRLIVAVRDNERASAAFGISPARVKIATAAFSGGMACVVGVVWADAWQNVSIEQFPPELSLGLLAAPIIGGLGSIPGAAAGAAALYLPAAFVSPLLIGLLGQFGANVGFQLALGGIGIVGTLLVYPFGIAGAAQAVWERHLDRLARRRGELEPVEGGEDGPLAKPAGPSAHNPTVSGAAPGKPGKQKAGLLPSANGENANALIPELPLAVRDIAVSFGGIDALECAALDVRPGEIVGLIGPNGAGKTTLMNVISGTLRPRRGSVRVFGQEVLGQPAAARAKAGLGRSFQDATLFPGLTVIENIQVALTRFYPSGFVSSALAAPWARSREKACRQQAEEIVERFGLSPWAHAVTAELSTGTRRITDLAAQVAARPRLILLDEPTAGVAQRDAEAFAPLLRRVREELSCSILLIEHDMPLLMGLCDRVYALCAGRVVAEGTPEEVRWDPNVIASYLGTDPAAIERSGAAEWSSRT